MPEQLLIARDRTAPGVAQAVMLALILILALILGPAGALRAQTDPPAPPPAEDRRPQPELAPQPVLTLEQKHLHAQCLADQDRAAERDCVALLRLINGGRSR